LSRKKVEKGGKAKAKQPKKSKRKKRSANSGRKKAKSPLKREEDKSESFKRGERLKNE